MPQTERLNFLALMTCAVIGACTPVALPEAGTTTRSRLNLLALAVDEPVALASHFTFIASAGPEQLGDRPRAKAKKCTIEILTPENDVGPSGKVIASASPLPDGATVWILARREDFAPAWWLQRRAMLDGADWMGTAYYGGTDDVNWKFDVAALVFAAEDDALLDRKFVKMQETNDWKPVRVPTPLCGDQRKVLRSR